MKHRKVAARVWAASIATASLFSVGTGVAPAASFTWDGGGSDDMFGTALNWTSDLTPVANDALLFAGTTRLTPSNNMPAGTSFGGITFDVAAATFTVGGNALSLPALGHIVNSGTTNLQTLAAPVTLLAGEHLITGNTGGLALTGGLTRGTGATGRFSGTVSATGLSNNASGIIGTWATHGVDYAAVGSGTLAGQIVPYTSFTELGTNPATPLANSPGVNIRWSQGVIGGDGAGTLNLAAGLIDINTFSAPINNTQTIIFQPTTTLRFGAQGGILRGANPSGLGLTFGPFASEGVGTITAGGADNTDGELFLNSAFTVITLRPVIADNGTGKVRVVSANGRLGQSASNSLGAHNTYTGGSYVISGDLSASEKDSFGTGSVEVASGARAVANPVNATTVADATYTNDFYLRGFGTPGASGLNEGALRVSRLADIAGTIHLLEDSQITFRFANGTLGSSISGKITGSAALTFGDSGANTLFSLKNATNDWTGETNLLRGTLVIGGTGEVIPNGPGKGNFNLTAPAGTVNLNGNTETVNGLNGGTSALDLLRIINTSTVTTGTLRVGDNNASGSFGGMITESTSTQTFGTVAVKKIGTGQQTLFGANTYSGTTTVEAGRLVLRRNDDGNDGRNAWVPVLEKGGADVKGGRLVFEYVSGAPSPAGTISTILKAGFGQTPKFSTGQLRTSNPEVAGRVLGWRDDGVSQLAVAYTYQGDADLDGDADGVDIGTWATNFTGELSGGATATQVWAQGDWDYDGDVDGVDAGLWATVFTGELSGGGLGAVVQIDTALSREASAILQGLGITVVPEPASLGIAGTAAALTLHRRRRRIRLG